MSLTVWFDDPSAVSRRDVGGKAAQLAELTRAGMPIPAGFVLTTAALREFFADERLAAALACVCAADEDEHFDHLADVLVGLIRTTEIPERIVRAVLAAARSLGDDPLLAVRASADETAVDPHVLDMTASVLDVDSEEALLDAVRICWASLFSPPVLHRQRRAGLLDGRTIRGGVVVQKMIDADKSGIAFSVEPRSADPMKIEIDSTFGESEPLLTGAIEGDRYLLDKNTLQLINSDIRDKRVELVHDSEHASSQLRVVSEERARTSSLTENEVRAVAELARRAEEHFHEPRGLEFIVSGSMLFAIETRPVAAYRALSP